MTDDDGDRFSIIVTLIDSDKKMLGGLQDAVVDDDDDWYCSKLANEIVDEISFTGTFVPDDDQQNAYQKVIDAYADTPSKMVIKFPVKLWRRIVLWVIGVHPFPPSTHDITGTLVIARSNYGHD